MLSLIVAHSKNRCIGKEGSIPWHLRADLQRVKKLTTGNSIIMGRKTFESIGKPLPHRQNIVVTRNPNFRKEGIDVATSLQEALSIVDEGKTPFIFGGQSIYKETLPHVEKMYVTEIDVEVESGDAFFPEIDMKNWIEKERQCHKKDESNDYNYCFVTYEKHR